MVLSGGYNLKKKKKSFSRGLSISFWQNHASKLSFIDDDENNKMDLCLFVQVTTSPMMMANSTSSVMSLIKERFEGPVRLSSSVLTAPLRRSCSLWRMRVDQTFWLSQQKPAI